MNCKKVSGKVTSLPEEFGDEFIKLYEKYKFCKNENSKLHKTIEHPSNILRKFKKHCKIKIFNGSEKRYIVFYLLKKRYEKLIKKLISKYSNDTRMTNVAHGLFRRSSSRKIVDCNAELDILNLVEKRKTLKQISKKTGFTKTTIKKVAYSIGKRIRRKRLDYKTIRIDSCLLNIENKIPTNTLRKSNVYLISNDYYGMIEIMISKEMNDILTNGCEVLVNLNLESRIGLAIGIV